MKTIRMRVWLTLLGCLTLAPTAFGQPVGAPTTAASGNLWSYLLMTPDQKLACKTWWCNCGIGQLVAGASGPVGMATGGLFGGCCAKTAIEDAIANKAPEGSESTAARIMKDEAEAKARRMAVRYLGTVDCNYWPDAAKALRLSLRFDPNECVRFEAALALRNGCCCTNEIIKALEYTVTSSKADGAPAERSDRVRAAAADALGRCPLIESMQDEKKDIKKVEGPVDPKQHYEKVASMPRDQVIASARSALASLQSGGKLPMTTISVEGTTQTMQPQPIHRRPGTLAGVLTNTFQFRNDQPMPGIGEPEYKSQMMPAIVSAPVTPVSPPAKLPPASTVSPYTSSMQSPIMVTPNTNSVPASTVSPYTSSMGLKVEVKTPVPATNPNTIRQSTGWVTVETAPATIGAPMPVGPMGVTPRK